MTTTSSPAKITHTATLPNGEIATRTSGAAYVAAVAAYDPAVDTDWTARTWHRSTAAAEKIAAEMRAFGWIARVVEVAR